MEMTNQELIQHLVSQVVEVKARSTASILIRDVMSREWNEQQSSELRSLRENLAHTIKEVIDRMKVMEAERVSIVRDDDGLPEAHCPKCDAHIDMFGAHCVETRFCPWCGQAVKWND